MAFQPPAKQRRRGQLPRPAQGNRSLNPIRPAARPRRRPRIRVEPTPYRLPSSIASSTPDSQGRPGPVSRRQTAMSPTSTLSSGTKAAQCQPPGAPGRTAKRFADALPHEACQGGAAGRAAVNHASLRRTTGTPLLSLLHVRTKFPRARPVAGNDATTGSTEPTPLRQSQWPGVQRPQFVPPGPSRTRAPPTY